MGRIGFRQKQELFVSAVDFEILETPQSRPRRLDVCVERKHPETSG